MKNYPPWPHLRAAIIEQLIDIVNFKA